MSDAKKYGYARFIVSKHDEGVCGIEEYHREGFTTEPLFGHRKMQTQKVKLEGEKIITLEELEELEDKDAKRFHYDTVNEEMDAVGTQEELSFVLKEHPLGCYEIVGEIHCWWDRSWTDCGYEYDGGWSIENAEIISIKEEDAEQFLSHEELCFKYGVKIIECKEWEYVDGKYGGKDLILTSKDDRKKTFFGAREPHDIRHGDMPRETFTPIDRDKDLKEADVLVRYDDGICMSREFYIVHRDGKKGKALLEKSA
jgi:hypothetical protein